MAERSDIVIGTNLTSRLEEAVGVHSTGGVLFGRTGGEPLAGACPSR